MIGRRGLLTSAVGVGAGLVSGVARPTADAVAGSNEKERADVLDTTVEYVREPLGLDVARPRLTWSLGSDTPEWRQTAYQVRVATSPAELPTPDVWDSGKVRSDQSVLVPYDGPELRPRTRYHWSVRVWDVDDVASQWSSPSWWETGLLTGSEWSARWVAAPTELTGAPSLEGSSWIWFPEGDPATEAPAATRWFRRSFDVPDGVTRARLVLTVDDSYTAYVNGAELDHVETGTDDWRLPTVFDVTTLLRPGPNVIAVAATNTSVGPAGLLGVLELTGGPTVPTDQAWKVTDQEPSGDWTGAGYDDSAWADAMEVAAWGADPWGTVLPAYFPGTQLRHEFRLADKPIARARLYATALGLYEPHLNGGRVGTDQLAPGWTDYNQRVQYQTYDVTDLVRGGNNALAVHLAFGWYAGSIAWFGPHQYGDRPGLLAQLEVVYEDGSSDNVLSDTDWRAASGPIVSADPLAGEQYDARLETAGWTEPGFDDSGWLPVEPIDDVTATVVAELDGPVRVHTELPAVAYTEPEPGTVIFDLGQNMVGSVRLRVSGEAGTTVRLRHGEVLDADGMLYTANLRSARATDTYTLKGEGEETYEPRFTFHGFRYAEVTGYPGTPPLTAVTGRVMHTSAPFTFEFETDVPMLNQLHSNITWGQRGNFLSVPTDTPARDERLGWTGDINVFAPTAAYTMESARFLGKWLWDLRDGQAEDGGFTDYAPAVGTVGKGTAGWGDAGVTVPWALYQVYGDVRVLSESWPAMLDWLSYLEQHSNGYLRPAEGYGDWLNVDDETPKDVIGTAYFAHSADLTARVARALGEDPAPYETLFANVREAFRTAYVSGDGTVKGDTQTAYVLALSMNLLPDSVRELAADRLVALIEARGWHLSTGFLGTPRLLQTLTDTGHIDVAYRLLHQRDFPSWGYQIGRGSTTMWERWDSIRPDGSFQDPGMNSFNHYAYGSVGEWMYANIAGIAPGAPGFGHIVIRPRPGGEVRSAKARFASLYGPIGTRWTNGPDGFDLEVTVPANTTADVWVPAANRREVSYMDANFLRMQDGCAVFAVGPGRHRFAS